MNEYSMEDLIPVVAKLTEKYTSKESSSVSYEKAKQLMEAVIYCIDELEGQEYDREEKQHPKSSQRNAQDDYDQGYQLVVHKVKQVKERYERILENFQHYGNLCLKETVLKGIPGFLLYYDARFNPQDSILTFDYPTLIDPLKKRGVDAVDDYLKSIEIEQEWLSIFPTEYICSVLESYHNDYPTLFINISTIVIRNLFGSMIVKKPVNKKRYTQKDYTEIQLWVQWQEESLVDRLHGLLQIMIQKGYGDHQEMLQYFTNDLEDFAVELENACRNHCLDHLFIY